IEELPLEAVGHVPWWGTPRVTLHRVLTHMIAETHRHAGHADIVRELIDGTAGMRGPGDNVVDRDEACWARYRERLERLAGGCGLLPAELGPHVRLPRVVLGAVLGEAHLRHAVGAPADHPEERDLGAARARARLRHHGFLGCDGHAADPATG